jgi:hypothetical protein
VALHACGWSRPLEFRLHLPQCERFSTPAAPIRRPSQQPAPTPSEPAAGRAAVHVMPASACRIRRLQVEEAASHPGARVDAAASGSSRCSPATRAQTRQYHTRRIRSRSTAAMWCTIAMIMPIIVAASRWAADEMEVDADTYCGGCRQYSTCIARFQQSDPSAPINITEAICACDSGWTRFAALKVTDDSCSGNLLALFILHAAWLFLAAATLLFSLYKLAQSISAIRTNYAKKLTKAAEDRLNDNNVNGGNAANAAAAGAEPSKRGHQRNRSGSGIMGASEIAALPMVTREQTHGSSISMGTASMRSRQRATYVKPSFVTNGTNALTASYIRRATHGVSSQRSHAAGDPPAEGAVDFAAVLRAIKGGEDITGKGCSMESTPASTSQSLGPQMSPKPGTDKNERFAVSRRMQTMNRPGIDTRLSPQPSHGSLTPQPLTPNNMNGESQNSRQEFGGDLSARQRQSTNGAGGGNNTARSMISDHDDDKQLTAEDFDEDEIGPLHETNPSPPTVPEDHKGSSSPARGNLASSPTPDRHIAASPTSSSPDAHQVLSPSGLSGVASPSEVQPTRYPAAVFVPAIYPASSSRPLSRQPDGAPRMTPTTDRVSSPQAGLKPHVPALQFPPPPPAIPPAIPPPVQAKTDGAVLADALEALQSSSETASPVIPTRKSVQFGSLPESNAPQLRVATSMSTQQQPSQPAYHRQSSDTAVLSQKSDDAGQLDLNGSVDFGTTMGGSQVFVHRNAAHFDLTSKDSPPAQSEGTSALSSPLSRSDPDSTMRSDSAAGNTPVAARADSSLGAPIGSLPIRGQSVPQAASTPGAQPSSRNPHKHTRVKSRDDLAVPVFATSGVRLPLHHSPTHGPPSHGGASLRDVDFLSRSLPTSGPSSHRSSSDASGAGGAQQQPRLVPNLLRGDTQNASIESRGGSTFQRGDTQHSSTTGEAYGAEDSRWNSTLSPAETPLSRITRTLVGPPSPAALHRKSSERGGSLHPLPPSTSGSVSAGTSPSGKGRRIVERRSSAEHQANEISELLGTGASGLHSMKQRRSSDLTLGDGSPQTTKRLTERKSLERTPHPVLGTPANIADKPAFILGLSSQRLDKKPRNKLHAGVGSGWNGSVTGMSSGIGEPPSVIAPTRASTTVAPPVSLHLLHVSLLSPQFVLECLKHISFQYSFGSVLVCVVQLMHTPVQLYSDASAWSYSNSAAFAAVPTSIRTIGSDAFVTTTYAIAFTVFSVISHLFFGSHLKLAYSMVGLRGAGQGLTAKVTKSSAGVSGNGADQASNNNNDGGIGGVDGGLAIVPGSRRGSRVGAGLTTKGALAGSVQATAGGVKRDSASGDQGMADAGSAQPTPRVRPSVLTGGPFQRASQNLLCRCFTQECESFLIKLYMSIECVILSALQLALSAAPYAKTSAGAELGIRMCFVSATVMLVHFAVYSRVFTISLKSLISAGTQSLNLKQFSERKSVLYRLQVLIWTNRVCGGLGAVGTIMLIASDSFRQTTGAYILPLLAFQMDLILLSRLWSLNWRVKQQAPSGAAVGQSSGVLDGPAFPMTARSTTLAAQQHQAAAAAMTPKPLDQAVILGLSSFKLRPGRDHLTQATGSFRNRPRARQPSISVSSQSSLG